MYFLDLRDCHYSIVAIVAIVFIYNGYSGFLFYKISAFLGNIQTKKRKNWKIFFLLDYFY